MKVAKIRTLNLVSRVIIALMDKRLISAARNRIDLATETNFIKKYQELAYVSLENLVNHEFLVYHRFDDGHVTGSQGR